MCYNSDDIQTVLNKLNEYWNDEDGDEDGVSHPNFRSALEDLLNEYNLYSNDEDVDYFIEHLYHE